MAPFVVGHVLLLSDFGEWRRWDRGMRVVASVAHRGAYGFLPALLQNVIQFVEPSHTCVFTWANVTNTSTRTVFVEPDVPRRRTALVLLRHLRCAAYIGGMWPHLDASRVMVVPVAANMRFHRRCILEPSTFSLEPMGAHDWDADRHVFEPPPRHGDARWKKMLDGMRLNRHTRMPTFVRVLQSTNVTPWRPTPLVQMPHEGSYASLADMLAARDPILRLIASVSTVAPYPEETLLPTWLLQQRNTTTARPLMCVRVFTSNRSLTYARLLSSVASAQGVCALKIAGREHLFA